jgi:hypothetical protein
MTGHRSVFDLSRSLTNRDGLGDRLAALADLAAVTTSIAEHASATQVRQELFFQHTTRLDEETAVDRLVRHPPTLIVAKRSFKPSGNLLRRPVEPELGRDRAGQSRVLRQPPRSATTP